MAVFFEALTQIKDRMRHIQNCSLGRGNVTALQGARKENTEMSLTEEAKSMLEIESGGSLVEAAGGIAVIVLSIIGLARVGESFMTSIATIVLGVALLAEGGTIAAQFSKLLSVATGGTLGAMQLGGGMTTEILGGGAAIVLGILGLVGLYPMLLLPAAVIAVGGSLVLTAGAVERLNELRVQSAGLSEMAQKVAQAAVSGAVGMQVLAGIAAIVLGILALASESHAATLTLVGLLVLGSAVTISGTALAGRFMRMFA
jgi:hypothetical protein